MMDFLRIWGHKLLAFLKYVADIIGELITGGFLVPQTELVYGEALGGEDSLIQDIRHLAVKERDSLITESMDVQGTDGPYCTIKGIELLFTKRDFVNFYLANELVCKIHQTQGTRSFNVYRGTTGEKIGWVEKVVGTNDYGFYGESESKESPSETTMLSNSTTQPLYKLSGDFINRRFLMKNGKGENVAKIKKQVIAFPAFDHYTVRIAPGMDPILVLACLYVIDEDIEDSLKDKVKDAVASKIGL